MASDAQVEKASVFRTPQRPLTDLDRELIALLQRDGRMAYREIARELGCSDKTARARVRSLLDANIIEITAIAPPHLISHSGLASIGIRVAPHASITDLARRLAELDKLDYVAIGAGRFHIYAEAICQSKAELLQVMEDDVNRLEGIQHFEVFPYLELTYQKGLAYYRSDSEVRPVKFDPTDLRILEQLTVDGRMPFRTIATKVGASETLVRQRVKALRDGGAVRISAITNPMSMGLTTAAWIGINVACGNQARRVASDLAEMPEVNYVALTSGSMDMFVEVLCTDDLEFLHVLDRMRMVPGIAGLDAFMYLDLHYEPPRFVLDTA